jgi:hypothetical protein
MLGQLRVQIALYGEIIPAIQFTMIWYRDVHVIKYLGLFGHTDYWTRFFSIFQLRAHEEFLGLQPQYRL